MKFLLVFLSTIILISCRKDGRPIYDPHPVVDPPISNIKLKDITLEHLPSPFYHFQYDGEGRVNFISYASGLFNYDVNYENGRIVEMINHGGNNNRIQYLYDAQGRVSIVKVLDDAGLVKARYALTYDGSRLIEYERQIRVDGGFIIDKTISLTYYPDGNLQDLTVHLTAINGQPESTFTTRYSGYDNKHNVEGVGLLHQDFFEHFIYLPSVQLQKNNPGKETRTGSAADYTVDYTYTYNEKETPVTRNGDFIYTTGTNQGQRYQLRGTFSYYD